MRALIKSTLEANGYEVVAVCDGQEGLNFAKEEAVDLVITDVNMPNMDGLTLIGKLRELPKYRHTPILVLTTEVANEKCDIARKAGASGWMVKPFDPIQLSSIVKRFVD